MSIQRRSNHINKQVASAFNAHLAYLWISHSLSTGAETERASYLELLHAWQLCQQEWRGSQRHSRLHLKRRLSLSVCQLHCLTRGLDMPTKRGYIWFKYHVSQYTDWDETGISQGYPIAYVTVMLSNCDIVTYLLEHAVIGRGSILELLIW